MYKDIYSKLEHTQSKIPFHNATECQKPIDLTAESGAIPSWLHGIMYRIGPGRFNIRKNDGTSVMIRHAFDGLPFLHRFELNGQTQTLTYNSRMTAKSMEKAIQNDTLKGQIFFAHLERQESLFGWLSRAIARFKNSFADNSKLPPDANTISVTTTPNFPLPHQHQNERVLVSKTDANILQKVHADTLEPELGFSYTSFDKRLEGQLSAAHHQWDPKTNEIFNFTLTIAPTPRFIVFSTDASGKTTVLADFKHRTDGTKINAPYTHAFWLTKNYVILPEAPLFVKKPLDLFLTGSILSALCWDEHQPTYFHVIHRDGRGLAASIPVKSFFLFHTANAFEKDGKLYLDCAAFENCDIMHQLQTFGQPYEEKPAMAPFELNGIQHPVKTQENYGDLVRYVVDVEKRTANKQMITTNIEFPRFNHSKALEMYTFVYGCRLYGVRNTGSLTKINVNTGDVKEFVVEGHSCSEPIFVPKPDSTEEDDGVLVSLMNSPECCYLVVIDAVEMKELARYKIGQFTALTFHGSFVDHEFKTISPN